MDTKSILHYKEDWCICLSDSNTHPFYITTHANGGADGQYTTGVTGNVS